MWFFVRIVLVFWVIALLPTTLVYFKFLRNKPNRKQFNKWLWTVATLQCVGFLAFVMFAFTTGSADWTWRMFFSVFLGVAGVEIFVLLGTGIACMCKKTPLLSRTMYGFGTLLALLNIIMVAMAFIIGNKRIDVTEYTYSSKDLPQAFDGFRVVQISDLHLGTYGTDTTRVSELIDKTLAQKGDIILFTGDLVNFESKEALPFIKQLSRLNAPYGVYAIMGNHDYGVYRNFATKQEQLDDIQKLVDIEKQCGWTVLRNQNALIEKDGARIALIGVENDGKPPFPRLADIPKALNGLPDSDKAGMPLFKIMMTHDPSHWRRNVLGETDAQLTLAGHTHGMQFKLGNWSPASLVYKEWGGQYFEGPRSLIVSIGLGLGAVPFRFGAWSEVCVITLKKQ